MGDHREGDGSIVARRRLRWRVAAGSAVLVLAVLVPVLAFRLSDSPNGPRGVELSDRATTRSSVDPDHRQSALESFHPRPPETAPSSTDPAPTTTLQGDEAAGPPTSQDPPPGGGGATTTCPLPAFPSAACTGVPAGTNLTVVDGDVEVDTANTVIDGQDIRGCVLVNAPGVVVRRSKMNCVASEADSYSGAAVVLEDVEIDCGNSKGTTAVGDYNFTVRRANIHSCENGFDVDGRVRIEDSYIHDLLRYDPAEDPHTDGIQITPVGNDITIVHNTIYAGDGTSAIITNDLVSNVLVKDNLMAGGAYTLYCPQGGRGTNYRVVGNHFTTQFSPSVGAYGPWTECEDEAEVTGNVFHESGQPVPLP